MEDGISKLIERKETGKNNGPMQQRRTPLKPCPKSTK
jgi:hypothetical protein